MRGEAVWGNLTDFVGGRVLAQWGVVCGVTALGDQDAWGDISLIYVEQMSCMPGGHSLTVNQSHGYRLKLETYVC